MKKRDVVLLHVLFWALMVNIFAIANLPKGPANPAEELPMLFVKVVRNMGLTLMLFYSAYFSLNFFLRKPNRFIWLAGGFIIIIVLLYGHQRVSMEPVAVLAKLLFAFSGVLQIFAFLIFGFLFRMVIQGIETTQRNRQLEKEKLSTQLELLKSQINPHFLFNTLNNIDILIQEDPERASQYLNKLSDILRFSLYETRQKTVPLESETDNIRKYIELQKIRTQNPSFATFTVEGDASDFPIVPMTFLPFVENAFKHSSNKKIENAIVINVVSTTRALQFNCKNHCGEVFQPEDGKSGLGMSLIRSRFDLLYPGRYSLEAVKTGDWYEVNLNINLDDH